MKEQIEKHLSTLFICKKSSRKIQAKQESIDIKRSWETLSFHLSTLLSFVLSSLTARPLQWRLSSAPSTHPFTIKSNRPKTTFSSHFGESLRPGSYAYSCSWYCTWTRSTGRAEEKPEREKQMLFHRMEALADHPSSPSQYRASLPPSLLLH